jgi:hypothetical protein
MDKRRILTYDLGEFETWDEWLVATEDALEKRGYTKYKNHSERSDFSYYKTFYRGEEKIYQVGLLFYDFRKFERADTCANRIGVDFKCYIICDDHVCMTVNKDMSIEEFEELARVFYFSMIGQLHSLNVKRCNERGEHLYGKDLNDCAKGRLYTVEDWNQSVEDGDMDSDDGTGYWCRDGMRSDEEVFRTEQLDATHVVWYNK